MNSNGANSSGMNSAFGALAVRFRSYIRNNTKRLSINFTVIFFNIVILIFGVNFLQQFSDIICTVYAVVFLLVSF
jgi:hypothetical protein